MLRGEKGKWESISFSDLSEEQQKTMADKFAKETGDDLKFAKEADYEINRVTREVRPSSEEGFQARKKEAEDKKKEAAKRGV